MICLKQQSFSIVYSWSFVAIIDKKIDMFVATGVNAKMAVD